MIDLDIARFFDSVPWDLVVTAVEANTELPWVVLYVKRWLHAPLQLADGSLSRRDRGTPQGGYAQLGITNPMSSAGLCAALVCLPGERAVWWSSAAHNPVAGVKGW